jgi:hypothetical protein
MFSGRGLGYSVLFSFRNGVEMIQKDYGKGRKKGGLQCSFFIQEWGGDDAEGVREGEKEGRFTV